jgi:hypothetical protein
LTTERLRNAADHAYQPSDRQRSASDCWWIAPELPDVRAERLRTPSGRADQALQQLRKPPGHTDYAL